MATKLTRSIEREVDAFYQRDQLVVRVAPEGVHIKLKGQRWTSAYLMPWDSMFSVAAKLKADQIRREKAAEKKLKKGR